MKSWLSFEPGRLILQRLCVLHNMVVLGALADWIVQPIQGPHLNPEVANQIAAGPNWAGPHAVRIVRL